MPLTILAHDLGTRTHAFDDAHAVVTLSLTLAGEDRSLGEQDYQIPLPAQTLADGTTLDASPPLKVPGVPDVDEKLVAATVVARYWLASLGLPSGASDVDVTFAK